MNIFFIERSIVRQNFQYICRICEKIFYFNNKLHRHVRTRHVENNSTINHVIKKSIDKLINKLIDKSINESIIFDSISLFIIRFIALSQIKSIEYVFRS